MITKETIMEAYLFMRKENSSVPSETLEFMKDTALAELQKSQVGNLGIFSVKGVFIMKSLSEVTDQQCYEIAVLDGWKSLWEHDRGGADVPEEELIERGRDIIEGELETHWLNVKAINRYLTEHGYKCLNVFLILYFVITSYLLNYELTKF